MNEQTHYAKAAAAEAYANSLHRQALAETDVTKKLALLKEANRQMDIANAQNAWGDQFKGIK